LHNINALKRNPQKDPPHSSSFPIHGAASFFLYTWMIAITTRWSSLTTWPRLEGFREVYNIKQKDEASIFTPNLFGIYLRTTSFSCQPQWPCRLWRASVTPLLISFKFVYPHLQGYLSLLNVVCCQMEVPGSGRSLVQRSLTECNVANECGRENT
jgi:hypothetical protein